MEKDKNLIIGEKVDFMSMNEDTPYRSMIEDIKRDGLIYTSIPTSDGVPMMIHTNSELIMVFYRDTGRYAISVRVMDIKEKDGMRFVVLAQLSEPDKEQRRKYYRLPINLNAAICEYTKHNEERLPKQEKLAEAIALEIAGTKDISITGIALVTKHEYKSGDKYILKLNFEENPRGKTPPFIICAKVLRADYEQKNNTYRVAMSFFGQTKSMSDYLARYVLKQQQKQVMQRRLVEGA